MLFYNGIEISEDAILKTLLFNYYATNYEMILNFIRSTSLSNIRINIPYYYDKRFKDNF